MTIPANVPKRVFILFGSDGWSVGPPWHDHRAANHRIKDADEERPGSAPHVVVEYVLAS